MIVLSFVLVIVAAVTLIIGLFQDTLFWIWWSIGSCVVAMIFLGIGVLQRRSARPAQGEADAGYGPGAISGLLREEEEETEPAADVAADEDISVVPKRTVSEAREQIGVPEDADVDEEIVPSLGATASAGTPEETEPAAAAAETAEQEAAPPPSAAARRETTGAEARRQLEQVKGLGSAKLDALLARFGSLEAVQAASVEDLQQVKGFGAATAARVHEQVAQLDGGAAAKPAKKPRKKTAAKKPRKKAAKKTTKKAAKKTTGRAARERLGNVKGLGPAKQKALLDRFGSLESIRDADPEQLQEIKGIGEATAREVKRELS